MPPLVDLGTWSRSQAQHSRNARFSPRHAGPGRYLLRYLVHCDECGQVRQAHRRARPNGEYRCYRCTTALPMHLRAEKLRCSQPSARADELDELVWNEVTRHLDHPELILRACAIPAASTLTTDATRQLTDLRTQQARLLDAYQAGVISLRDLEARRRPVTDRTGELEQLARHAEHHRHTQAELKQRIDASPPRSPTGSPPWASNAVSSSSGQCPTRSWCPNHASRSSSRSPSPARPRRAEVPAPE